MSANVVIVGAAGRMGLAITRCLLNESVEGLSLAGAVDHAGAPAQGQDAGVAAGVRSAGVNITSNLPEVGADADVLIDFSIHAATAEHARLAATWGTAVVIGTTGLSEKELGTVEAASASIPVVMAPNMSLGVNLLFSLARQAATALRGKGYDVEIIEKHHRLKKDAPSGTALGLGASVAEGLQLDLSKVAKHGREGISKEIRPSDEIGIHAVRGGDVVGDHQVLFAADGEIVELAHRATSRDTFAIGALRAAAWVTGREPGLYSMQDVLGL